MQLHINGCSCFFYGEPSRLHCLAWRTIRIFPIFRRRVMTGMAACVQFYLWTVQNIDVAAP